MTNYLATIGDTAALADSLRSARAEVGTGSGVGGTGLKVNHVTGAVTFGPENLPFSKDHRLAVGLHEIQHGYLVATPPPVKVIERHMIPMIAGPRPVPPGVQYGDYEHGGAQNVVELGMFSIDEPGFVLTFTAWGGYNANAVGDLLDKAIVHLDTADGRAGYKHPVVTVSSKSDDNKKWAKTIHFIAFRIVDWLHTDGKTLLSERGGTAIEDTSAVKEGQEIKAGLKQDPREQRAPWDDEDDGEMTDAEQEVFGTA